MSWSYERLWIMLIKRKLKKTDLIALAHLNSSAIAKMGKGLPIAMENLGKICQYFGCKIEDVVEYISDGEEQ